MSLRVSFEECHFSELTSFEVAVILMTTRLVETCPEVISELKLKLKKPLIEEIPDRHGSAKIGETIDRYVSEAIGVKL